MSRGQKIKSHRIIGPQTKYAYCFTWDDFNNFLVFSSSLDYFAAGSPAARGCGSDPSHPSISSPCKSNAYQRASKAG